MRVRRTNTHSPASQRRINARPPDIAGVKAMGMSAYYPTDEEEKNRALAVSESG